MACWRGFDRRAGGGGGHALRGAVHGRALGYALVQPPLAGLAIFAALAVGVAAPLPCSAFRPRWRADCPDRGVDGHAQTCAGVSDAGGGGLAGLGAGCADGFGGASLHSGLCAGAGVQRVDLWLAQRRAMSGKPARSSAWRPSRGWWRLAAPLPCRGRRSRCRAPGGSACRP
jgi:thiol:disulfide interchange protein DsbD